MNITWLTSTVSDGTMKTINGDRETARQNRVKFLERNGTDPANATLHTLSYDTDDFCRYKVLSDADKGDGITRDSTFVADAVVTTIPSHVLLLPLADCVGAVIHDPTKSILMLSHLGRHNLEQFGGTKCIEFLIEKYDVNPGNLTVWLSPAAGKDNYPLFAFNNRSMHDIATEQLQKAGIKPDSIVASPIDVTTDTHYFSHSQFLKGNRDVDGRFCVVAMMS
jgi:copper oxidase (laccase) domain-containing protein